MIYLKKKSKKICQINHTFLFEIEFFVKNTFFEALHVEIAQKLQILEILLIFNNFSVGFQYANFL